VSLKGRIEHHDHELIMGWAYDDEKPDTRVDLQVCRNNKIIAEFVPSVFRWDLKQQTGGYGYHGFVYPLPAEIHNGRDHTIEILFSHSATPLENSPVRISGSGEHRFIPFKTTDLTGERVLVLSPHPDDESLGCGGSIAIHRDAGDEVKVVFLTDGALGAQGRPTEEYVELREREARAACHTLGAEDLMFWRYPDRNLRCDTGTTARLAALLDDYRPTLIYAPSPFEFHPDHQAAAQLVWAGLQVSQFKAAISYFEVNTPFRVNCLVDVSSVFERKLSACGEYASQLTEQPYAKYAENMGQYRTLTLPPSCTHAEGFLWISALESGRGTLEKVMMQHVFPAFNTSQKSNPVVSVIVRTCDRPSLLREALSSLVTQSYHNIQVIVVNAGADSVQTVVDEFSPYLDIIHHDSAVRLSRSAAANAGLERVTGKYVALLDDDDVLYPNHIEKLVSFLESTGEQFAYSDCERGTYTWDGTALKLSGPKEPFLGVDFDPEMLYRDNFIPSMTAMFTRAMQLEVGEFDESLDILEDWDYWIRLSHRATPQRVPGLTAEYRCLSDHAHDFVHWKNRIYAKYEDHHPIETDGDAKRWARVRLDAIQEENKHLRQRLLENEKRVMESTGTTRYARNHLLWRINQVLRGLFQRSQEDR